MAEAIHDPFYPFPVNMHATVHMHAHKAHEFFFLQSGTGSQHTRGCSYTMAPSDLYFFGGGIEHECRPGTAGGCSAHVLYIDPAAFSATSPGDRDCLMILNALRSITERLNNRLQVSDATKKQVKLFLARMVNDFWNKQPAFECAVKIQVQHLLLSLLRDSRLGARIRKHFTPVKGSERINDILMYLHHNFMNSIPVETCAKMAGMSRSHFHAAFQKSTRLTFVQFVNRLRIDAAIRMLRETDIPVLHIAWRCGFRCTSHFFHTFKKNTGITPHAMRKRNSGR